MKGEVMATTKELEDLIRRIQDRIVSMEKFIEERGLTSEYIKYVDELSAKKEAIKDQVKDVERATKREKDIELPNRNLRQGISL